MPYKGVKLFCKLQCLPFILRPERVGEEKWLDVLKSLGMQRGDPYWSEAFVPAMVLKGKKLGIHFNFDGNVGNSMKSLCLICWTRKAHPEKTEQLIDVMAREHFE